MVIKEKLSLRNIEKFKKIYKRDNHSYICDSEFFDLYNSSNFLVKYILRKQVKLLKIEDNYIGYIWSEFPCEPELSTIYSVYVQDEFINNLSNVFFNDFNTDILKYEAVNNIYNSNLMNSLGFIRYNETFLMKLDLKEYDNKLSLIDSLSFKHFKKNQDEELRCNIQNEIFYNNKRLPLSIQDIKDEENEDYFIEDFCVFLYDDKDNVLGYGQIILNNSMYTIANFGILPKYRGNGYSKVLVNYLIELCRINSISDIFIRVERDNNKALNLYEKTGFKMLKSYVTWVRKL